MKDLSESLKSQIQDLLDEGYNAFNEEDISESIGFLMQAWELLPVNLEDKVNYEEGYLTAHEIIETYYYSGNLKEAEKWIGTYIKSDTLNRNFGNAEFLAGKILYDQGELKKAKQCFAMANQKSDGRCFEEEDEKYLKLLNG